MSANPEVRSIRAVRMFKATRSRHVQLAPGKCLRLRGRLHGLHGPAQCWPGVTVPLRAPSGNCANLLSSCFERLRMERWKGHAQEKGPTLWMDHARRSCSEGRDSVVSGSGGRAGLQQSRKNRSCGSRTLSSNHVMPKYGRINGRCSLLEREKSY